MIEHGIDVGREYTLIGIVYLYSGVSPPEEGLRHVGTVVEHTVDLQIGTPWAQGEACHTFLMEHLLHLAHPYGHGSVFTFLDSAVGWHEG